MTKRTGSTTTSENSPKMRGVTNSKRIGSSIDSSGPPNGMPADRLHLHEEDLGDEDVAARELVDDVVEERDVLRLQRVPAGRQVADVAPVLEEERALVAVDRELRPERDVLVGVLVDDEVL
jgi:hypothetical protein